MAHYKLNKLQLHLNDDEAWRIEIPSLPELTTIGARRGHYVGDGKGNVQMLPVMFDDDSSLSFSARDNGVVSGYLSGDDYIEIVQYAHDRHIEVIPEIDVPGHSRAAIQALKNNPGYLLVDPDDRSEHVSPQGFTDNIVNPACEGTYRFLEEVFKTLNLLHQAAFVPLEHIHVGGDETPIQAWTLSPLCKAQGYENVDPKVDRANAEAVHKKIRSGLLAETVRDHRQNVRKERQDRILARRMRRTLRNAWPTVALTSPIGISTPMEPMDAFGPGNRLFCPIPSSRISTWLMPIIPASGGIFGPASPTRSSFTSTARLRWLSLLWS